MELNYVKHKIANLITIHKIVTIHYYELDKDFSFAGESHDFWEMVYVDAGQVEISADNRVFQLKQGEIAFHKPKEFHTIKTDGKNAANVFVISFVCSSDAIRFFKGMVTVVPARLKKYIASIIAESEETFHLMNVDSTRLFMRENPPIGGQQLIRIHLEEFLILLMRSEQQVSGSRIFPTKESMENHLVTQMLQKIEDNIYHPLTTAEICSSMHYSRSYLSKIFKESSGYTLSEYSTLLKIREAKKLIREGRKNFTQISDMLAFDNPHYFSRVFKRITGMTPTAYKNSVKRLHGY